MDGVLLEVVTPELNERQGCGLRRDDDPDSSPRAFGLYVCCAISTVTPSGSRT